MPHLPPITSVLTPFDDVRMMGARKTTQHALAPTPPITPPIELGQVAVSFAFDSINQTLQVVITDEQSGQVVRQFQYTRLPPDVHRSQMLNGLLLNQFA